MLISLFILLIFSIFFEGALTALPLVLITLICLTIQMKNSGVFWIAFFAGIFLDAFALRPIGGTSIFLLFFVFLMLQYQRKYEINSYPFVFISSFVGSLLFLVLFGYDSVIVRASESTIIAVVLFGIIRIDMRLNTMLHG
jgi:hypothetical protein